MANHIRNVTSGILKKRVKLPLAFQRFLGIIVIAQSMKMYISMFLLFFPRLLRYGREVIHFLIHQVQRVWQKLRRVLSMMLVCESNMAPAP